MTKFWRSAAIAMAILTNMGWASAQTIERVTAAELEAALSAAGLNPTMIEDSQTGAPVANGRAGEFSFFVRALSCSGAPTACENLMFFANFELGRPATANDFRIVNSFNDSSVFGRAYVLESDNMVGVDYVIELGGGVEPDHLEQNIGRWADIIAAFFDKFRAGAASS